MKDPPGVGLLRPKRESCNLLGGQIAEFGSEGPSSVLTLAGLANSANITLVGTRVPAGFMEVVGGTGCGGGGGEAG